MDITLINFMNEQLDLVDLGSVEKYWGCFFCFIVFCIFAL